MSLNIVTTGCLRETSSAKCKDGSYTVGHIIVTCPFLKIKKKKKCFQKNTSTFLLYRNVSSTTAKLILFHRCSFHPLKKKMKNKKKFNWHFFSSSLTVSFSEEFHIKWDRTKEGEIQILQETWMWGEKPFRRHDWSAEFVHRECQITLPGGTSNVTPEVSQMGQNVLVVNKNDKCLLFFFLLFVFAFFFPQDTAWMKQSIADEHKTFWAQRWLKPCRLTWCQEMLLYP